MVEHLFPLHGLPGPGASGPGPPEPLPPDLLAPGFPAPEFLPPDLLAPGFPGPEHLPPESPELVLDGPAGPHALGHPTVDSDADGRADTALADTADGLLLATDLDGDGHVDVSTLVGGTAPPGWDPGWDGPAPPAPVLDPVHGWERMA